MSNWLTLLGIFSIYLITGCSATSSESSPQTTESQVAQSSVDTLVVPKVEVLPATRGRLPLRKTINGLIRARRQLRVSSEIGGRLLITPEEGSYYPAGNLLALLDSSALVLAVQAAEVVVQEADFNHRDLLLQMGNAYPGDTLTEVQAGNILIRSGLPAAQVALAEAQFRLSQCRIQAPFGGYIADLSIQPGEFINATEEICTLIDPNSLEAEFYILEQELASIRQIDKVLVSPLSDESLSIPARLDIINPSVDEGGLVRVRAKLQSFRATHRLFVGMNVRLQLETIAAEAIVIPKRAMVLRAGREVVFVYEPDTQRAIWRYVEIAHENDEALALSSGLEEGDLVIVSGQLTLDHESPVRLSD